MAAAIEAVSLFMYLLLLFVWCASSLGVTVHVGSIGRILSSNRITEQASSVMYFTAYDSVSYECHIYSNSS